jgi:2-methylcitrate dehydratase PrpD
MWACRVPTHPYLEGIKSLRKQHPMPPDEIDRVELKVSKATLVRVGWPYVPTTITSAQLNLQYVASILLLENDVFVDQFTAGKHKAQRTMDMVNRVHIVHDPELDQRGEGRGFGGAPVKVTMKDGTVLEAIGRQRRGYMEAGGATGDEIVTKDDVLAKFRKMTKPHWSEETQNRVIALCNDIENLSDATELVKLMEIENLKPLDMEGD